MIKSRQLKFYVTQIKIRNNFKIRHLLLVPVMLVMITYWSCSDTVECPGKNSLSEFTHTMEPGEKSNATKAKHKCFIDFLKKNPDHVGWGSKNKKGVTYSIHPIEEPVPEGYEKFHSGPNSSLVIYMDLSSKDEGKLK